MLNRPLRTAVVVVASAVAMLGLAIAPAAATASPASEISVSATNCDAVMADTGPRRFDELTLDPAPRGGSTHGYVWVDRRSDAIGYNVCVGWNSGAEPYPYMATVRDNHADSRGAIAFITFEGWDGDSWTPRQRIYVQRADGAGQDAGYNARASKVRNFYVGVCLIAAGVVSYCNDERGSD
jgi:hypothetical protein